MKKFLGFLVGVGLLASAIYATTCAAAQAIQLGSFGAVTTVNATPAAGIPTTGSAVNLSLTDSRISYVAITVSGTYTASGGLIARGSADNYYTASQLGPYPFINATTGAISATIPSGATGTWYVNVSGLSYFRIDAEGAVTGTAYVGLSASTTAVPQTQLNTVASGVNTTTVAAATPTAVSTKSGMLVKVVVVTSGSAATLIYDNASANSGTVIGAIPASPAIGAVYTFNVPCSNGIYLGTTNTSSVTVVSD